MHKKGIIGLTLGILIPVLLLGTPVALLYGFFYTDEPSPVVKNPNFKKDVMLEDIVYQSMENTKTSKALNIGVSQDNINQLLLTAMDGVNETIKNYVGAPYVEIDSNNRTFNIYVNAQVPMFKTRLKIATNMEYISIKGDGKQSGVKFTIKDIVIGRGNIGSLAFNIAEKLVSDETINQIFAGAGINLKCNLAQRSLFYSMDDLVNDVINKSGIDNMYLSLMDFAISESLLSMNYKNNRIGIDLDLNQVITNDKYVDDTLSINKSSEIYDYIDDAEILLNNNLINLSDTGMVLNYLNHGYAKSSIEEQNIVKNLDLTCIGISNPMSHLGLNIVSNKDINQVFNEQMASIDPTQALMNKEVSIKFSENDFNETLKTSQIIGQTYHFHSLDKTGKHVLNAIYIDDFYTNIASDNGENKLNFIIGVNINGLSTKLIVSSKVNTVIGKKVELEIVDIHYGNIAANETMKKTCIDYVLHALGNVSTWFSIENGQLIFFDLDDCVANMDESLLKTALSKATLNASLDSENNKLDIKFTIN